MLFGLPKVLPLDGACKGCVLGNYHQAPFDFGKAWHLQTPQESVHNDICCINKSLLTGATYYLTFIDDLSRFTWAYFLKNWSHVFEKFKEISLALADK